MSGSSCDHYQRKCLLVAPCCGKTVNCRVCHDEVEEHNLDRKKVETIICAQCKHPQKVSTNCTVCGILFGKYSCFHCRLFDDRDKEQFHCDGCGICRVGGRDKFFHCTTCNMCLTVSIKDSHKCLSDVSKNNCPVCLEDIHTSRKEVHIPKCSHLMHMECYTQMLSHGTYTCPVCNRSLGDMKIYWKQMDETVEATIMPPLYQNYHVNILCRDCQQESNVNFHVIGLKCQHCGSYNTTRIGGDGPIPSDPLASLQGLIEEIESVEENEEEEGEADESWETVSEGEDTENTAIEIDTDTNIVNTPATDDDDENKDSTEENSPSATSNNLEITETIREGDT